MESQSQLEKASSRRRSVKSDKLSMEDYIEFLHSHQTLRLNVSQLNQIIRIHGFKRIHRAVKKNLIDAVDKLDLMDLPRSTLSESVSSFAILTLEDAVADLDELDWKDCCVTSIQILDNCKDNFRAPEQNNQIVVHCQPEIQTNAPKLRTVNENCNTLHEASRNAKQAQKMVPKRKRVNINSLDSSTMDCVSLASC